MASMLQPEFMSVAQARTVEELRHQVVGFAQHLGFSTVSATTVIDHVCGNSEFSTVDNTPLAYLSAFCEPASGKRDPVMQHCKRSSLPIIWDQTTYTHAGQGDLWDEQAAFGYHVGIALALHMPKGRHFFLGIDRDLPLPTGAMKRTELVASLQLFAVYAQEAASRLLLPAATSRPHARLTFRERDCLLWTMEGKTAWEIGEILSLSERTVAGTLGNALRKLDCVSKPQAVAKALRLGLLDSH
jgi:DNA-binding CsgD family transcriptional regulator